MKKISITFIIVLLLFILPACRIPALNLGMEDNGRDINIELGTNLVITLDSNPTTGYHWVISENSFAPGLILISDQYQSAETGQSCLGECGLQVLTFKAESSSVNTLVLDYLREWEPEPIDSYQLQVYIK